SVLCNINIQHNCATARCTGLQAIHKRQGHDETTRTKTVFDHTADNIFLLNTHTLHNYRRIAAVTP
ncbi:hypothetical protein PAXRUDRAFT_114240, partial [Paxillus rubicundulus Ve08.2h10]